MQSFFSIYSKIDNPTWEMVIFTFILSFLLSGLIAFTYEKTTHSTVKHFGLIQSFILSSLIATMILQAIGDNAAAGLGMLGALQIVQFRTNVRNPRDIVFMFASLGAGIACGLYGFFIASLGTILFCVIAFLIRFSSFHFSHLIVWEARLRSEEIVRLGDDFNMMMDDFCHSWTLECLLQDTDKEKILNNPNSRLYDYTILLKNEEKKREFLHALSVMGIDVVSLKKKNEK